MSTTANVKYIKPVNRLKEKTILNGPLAIDEETLELAEQAVADLGGKYFSIVARDMIRLNQEIEGVVESEDVQAGKLDAIFQLTHVIKGMGGTFDYDLITDIANSFCRFIESLEEIIKPGSKEIMVLHYDGLQVVLAEEMKGDGGQKGKELLKGTLSVVSNYNKAEST